MMDTNKFEEQFKKWLSGIHSEIKFWDYFISGDYFRDKGRTKQAWEDYISSERKFTLDEEIPDEYRNREYNFVDIGCGAYSRCGIVSDKVNLKRTYVDPLAWIYNKLKNKYNTNNGINITTGFVEMLDEVLPENEFDMVHMSNSLDHCFNPIFALYQLIRTCKIGGKVILRHAENEAERGNYHGFHQWNLSLKNDEQSFVVWNKSHRYDICDLLAEYVDFELSADVCEAGGTWVYNKVVMIKKKNIELLDNPYKFTIQKSIYEFLLSTLSDEVFMGIGDNRDKKIQYCFNLLSNMSDDELARKLKVKNISSVTIYGMGRLGKLLKDKIDSSNVTIVHCIDRNDKIEGYETIRIEEYKYLSSESIIITTVEENDIVDIKTLLEGKGINQEKIFSIKDIFGDAKFGNGL